MSIVLKQVSYTYETYPAQKTEALQRISLTIEDGAFVGIMGHTGCGKSTLMQLMAGLLKPGEGAVYIDGKDINEPSYDRRLLRETVGVVFQHPEYQLFETTVKKDVAFGLKYSGLSKAEKRERVKEALELVGLDVERIGAESPLSLSGGEKRRVAIAGVLVTRPRILILDEPMAGLDAGSREQFLRLAAQFNRRGVTILMVSHNADSLCQYAHRILVLEQGRLVLDGTPREVFQDTALTARLGIGTSQSREMAELLIKRDIPLSGYIVKYEELLEELERVFKKRMFQRKQNEVLRSAGSGTVSEKNSREKESGETLPLTELTVVRDKRAIKKEPGEALRSADLKVANGRNPVEKEQHKESTGGSVCR